MRGGETPHQIYFTRVRLVVAKKAAKKKTTKKARNKGGRPLGGKLITDDILAMMVEMVSRGYGKYDIKPVVEKELGQRISMPTYNTAMQKVRLYLREVWENRGDELRIEALAFYAEMRKRAPDWRDRGKAQERIDAILGHDAKFKQATTEDVDDLVERINAVRRKMRSTVPEEEE